MSDELIIHKKGRPDKIKDEVAMTVQELLMDSFLWNTDILGYPEDLLKDRNKAVPVSKLETNIYIRTPNGLRSFNVKVKEMY